VVAGGSAWVLFVFLTPTRSVRELVQQVIEDLGPSIGKAVGFPRRASSSRVSG